MEVEQYKDKTACITEALERLLYNTQEKTPDNTEVLQEIESELQKLRSEIQANYVTIQSKDTELQNYKNVLQSKESEIQRLQSVIQEAAGPAGIVTPSVKERRVREAQFDFKGRVGESPPG